MRVACSARGSQVVRQWGGGPNAGGEVSQEDYRHPAAGWGAARSVGNVLAQSRELIAGTRAIQRSVRYLLPPNGSRM